MTEEKPDYLTNAKERHQSSSMLIWYPVAEKIGLRMPKTHIIKFTDEDLKKTLEEQILLSDETMERVMGEIDENAFPYPIFIRTDLTSAKHSWTRTCFVATPNRLEMG